ncbi:MAG: hypothetical protein U5R30_12770 [Deltaproteobacteria bacterium]|nr:hypothetical protein [Deltaproteobacteria bacterium]
MTKLYVVFDEKDPGKITPSYARKLIDWVIGIKRDLQPNTWTTRCWYARLSNWWRRNSSGDLFGEVIGAHGGRHVKWEG